MDRRESLKQMIDSQLSKAMEELATARTGTKIGFSQALHRNDIKEARALLAKEIAAEKNILKMQKSLEEWSDYWMHRLPDCRNFDETKSLIEMYQEAASHCATVLSVSEVCETRLQLFKREIESLSTVEQTTLLNQAEERMDALEALISSPLQGKTDQKQLLQLRDLHQRKIDCLRLILMGCQHH